MFLLQEPRGFRVLSHWGVCTAAGAAASLNSPGPAKEGGSSTGEGHNPGKSNAHHGMARGEAEVSHGFADNDVALDSQDDQGPQGNLACGRERNRAHWGGKSNSGLDLPFTILWLQQRAEGTEELGISKEKPASY